MSRGISAPAPGSHSFTAAIIPLEIPTAGEKAAKHSALLREFSTPATSPAYLGPQYISNPPTTPTPAPIPAQSPMTASPTTPLSPPTRSLDVIKKRAGHGRIIFCKARSNHKSQTLDYFAGRRLKSRTISEMKMKLWWHLKPDHYTTADYLATAAGNMLERIVEWDRDQAEAMERENACALSSIPVLSSIPTTEHLNEIDARYLVERFRRVMLSLPREDYRSAYGKLPEELLLGLLHYTFMIARPVLAWELDLDSPSF